MELDDIIISRAITESFTREFSQAMETEVAVAGAGPSGLTAAYYLAKTGIKTVIFERNLQAGGGMPGGGMMFNKIVVQKSALEILQELEIRTELYQEGYYLANSLEAASALTYRAIKEGVKIFNLMGVEDVMVKENRVCGLVINWQAVTLAQLQVDPLSIRCRMAVDATGHGCEIIRKLLQRSSVKLATPEGKIMGEGAMWAEKGEQAIIDNTGEVYPGLYVSGMAANGVYGSPRMGPIFGGMLLSGKKIADLIIEQLR